MSGEEISLDVDRERLSQQEGFYGTYMRFDPSPLPAICTHCAEKGTVEEELQFADPMPAGILRSLGVVFAGLPLALAVIAGIVWAIWGAAAAGRIVPVFVAVGAAVGAFTGLKAIMIAAGGRAQWGLTFRLCAGCRSAYRWTKRALVAVFSLAVVAFPFWGVIALVFWYGRPKFHWGIAALVASFPLLSLGAALLNAALARARGFSIRWNPEEFTLSALFRDPRVAAALRENAD